LYSPRQQRLRSALDVGGIEAGIDESRGNAVVLKLANLVLHQAISGETTSVTPAATAPGAENRAIFRRRWASARARGRDRTSRTIASWPGRK